VKNKPGFHDFKVCYHCFAKKVCNVKYCGIKRIPNVVKTQKIVPECKKGEKEV